jgi:hypothetical protein
VLTSIYIDEWLREVELSPKVIWISSPFLPIQCQIRDTTVNSLNNPTVGANIMSDSFVLTFLGSES